MQLLNRSSLACVEPRLRNKRFENCEMRSIVVGGWTPPLPSLEYTGVRQIVSKQSTGEDTPDHERRGDGPFFTFGANSDSHASNRTGGSYGGAQTSGVQENDDISQPVQGKVGGTVMNNPGAPARIANISGVHDLANGWNRDRSESGLHRDDASLKKIPYKDYFKNQGVFGDGCTSEVDSINLARDSGTGGVNTRQNRNNCSIATIPVVPVTSHSRGASSILQEIPDIIDISNLNVKLKDAKGVVESENPPKLVCSESDKDSSQSTCIDTNTTTHISTSIYMKKPIASLTIETEGINADSAMTSSGTAIAIPICPRAKLRIRSANGTVTSNSSMLELENPVFTFPSPFTTPPSMSFNMDVFPSSTSISASGVPSQMDMSKPLSHEVNQDSLRDDQAGGLATCLEQDTITRPSIGGSHKQDSEGNELIKAFGTTKSTVELFTMANPASLELNCETQTCQSPLIHESNILPCEYALNDLHGPSTPSEHLKKSHSNVDVHPVRRNDSSGLIALSSSSDASPSSETASIQLDNESIDYVDFLPKLISEVETNMRRDEVNEDIMVCLATTTSEACLELPPRRTSRIDAEQKHSSAVSSLPTKCEQRPQANPVPMPTKNVANPMKQRVHSATVVDATVVSDDAVVDFGKSINCNDSQKFEEESASHRMPSEEKGNNSQPTGGALLAGCEVNTEDISIQRLVLSKRPALIQPLPSRAQSLPNTNTVKKSFHRPLTEAPLFPPLPVSGSSMEPADASTESIEFMEIPSFTKFLPASAFPAHGYLPHTGLPKAFSDSDIRHRERGMLDTELGSRGMALDGTPTLIDGLSGSECVGINSTSSSEIANAKVQAAPSSMNSETTRRLKVSWKQSDFRLRTRRRHSFHLDLSSMDWRKLALRSRRQAMDGLNRSMASPHNEGAESQLAPTHSPSQSKSSPNTLPNSLPKVLPTTISSPGETSSPLPPTISPPTRSAIVHKIGIDVSCPSMQ